jgi:hypothetical protein
MTRQADKLQEWHCDIIALMRQRSQTWELTENKASKERFFSSQTWELTENKTTY